MPLLGSHLEQISSSAKTIAELKFPPPKIFTNALLSNHEITTLIRDTEPHERSLFSLDPSVGRSRKSVADIKPNGAYATERGHPRKSMYSTVPPVQQSAVARVLGPEMLSEIRQSGSRGRGVNVEVLLRGAEKLCEAYSVAGTSEKIIAIRKRHQQIAISIGKYEEKVLKQQAKLNRFHSGSGHSVGDDEDVATPQPAQSRSARIVQEDIEAEEAEVRELEERKRALENRVAGIEKDLGGLLK